ncbi:uncharacterized protein RJT20DRAFT_131366 [Scheffersomyces xylosifermentans]|uniref:uncharacterized protein n=1 Tax=Scheffersomyces xylosifermentans TaxID=1304137 RepID=UPI00315DC511
MSSLREKYEKSRKLGYSPRKSTSIYPSMYDLDEKRAEDSSSRNKSAIYNNVNISNFAADDLRYVAKPVYSSLSEKYDNFTRSKVDSDKENRYSIEDYGTKRTSPYKSRVSTSFSTGIRQNDKFGTSRSVGRSSEPFRYSGATSTFSKPIPGTYDTRNGGENYKSSYQRTKSLPMSSPIKSIRKSTAITQPSSLYKVLNSTPNSGRKKIINQFQSTARQNGTSKISKPQRTQNGGLFSKLRGYLQNFSLDHLESDDSNVNLLKDSARDLLNINVQEKRGDKRVSFEEASSVNEPRPKWEDIELDNDIIDDTISNTKVLKSLLEDKKRVELEQELRYLNDSIKIEKKRNETLIKQNEDSLGVLHREYQSKIDELNDTIARLAKESDSKIHKEDLSREYERLLVQQKESAKHIETLEKIIEELKAELQERNEELKLVKMEFKLRNALKSISLRIENEIHKLQLNRKDIQQQIEKIEHDYRNCRKLAVGPLPPLSSKCKINSDKISEGIGRAVTAIRESNNEGIPPSTEVKQFYDGLQTYLENIKSRNRSKLEQIELQLSVSGPPDFHPLQSSRLYQKAYSALLKIRIANELEKEALKIKEYLEDAQAIAGFDKTVAVKYYSKLKFEISSSSF